MLIWLEGHLSPQKLRDAMASSEVYRDKMFRWVESVIKCELPGVEEVIPEQLGKPSPRPKRSEETGNPHPGVIPAPSIHAFERHEEFHSAYQAFVCDLIKEYSWHEHRSTCFKYVEKGTIPTDPGRRDALCRMRIDGSTRARTELDTETGAILLRRLQGRVANYNDVVVFLMKCNMDIKHIGSGEAAKALLYYVTDYITKDSLPAHIGLGALSYAIQKTTDKFSDLAQETAIRGALTTTVNRLISKQEISHQQVMSYLVGGGDVYTDRTYTTLHWGSFDRLVRAHFKESRQVFGGRTSGQHSLHPEEAAPAGADEQDDMDVDGSEVVDDDDDDDDDDDEDEEDAVLVDDRVPQGNDREETFVLQLQPGSISATNQQQDYIYRNTDPEFESLSLYEFVGTVSKVSLKQLNMNSSANGGRGGRRRRPRGLFSSPNHTQFMTHGLRKRSDWHVPVVLGDRIPRPDREPEEREAWARTMLILFVPWRTPSDLRGSDESWLDAFERRKNDIPKSLLRVMENMSVLSECRDARDTYRNLRRSEALAFMREGLPENGMEHSGTSDGELGGDFELFDKTDVQNIYDSIGDDEAVRSSLDDVVGPRVRQVLDACYCNDGLPRLPSVSEHRDERVRVRVDTDEPTLLQEQAIMRHLKRQRRPKECGGDDIVERPAKRRRRNRPDNVQEHVSRNTLGAETGGGSTLRQDDVSAAAEQVIREMGLESNPEQERAFRLVAERVAKPDGDEQLLMYMAGVGGTGKTHVVKSILRLFALLGRSNEILVGAPTGAAALNIGGYTVHSLMMLPSKKTKTLLKNLRSVWASVKYFIIDEVSMIGVKFLAEVSRRLQLAKGDTGVDASKPFGGVNVIFTGDFGQLKPVKATALFNHQYVNHPGLQAIRDHSSIDNLKGIYLWRQVNTVVKLMKNQRQSADPVYADLLARVRVGEGRDRPSPDTGNQSDVDILYRRITHQVAKEEPDSLKNFRDAPIIVGTKALRDALNARIIAHKSNELGVKVTILHAQDKISRVPVSGALQQGLWKLSSSSTDDALGSLPIFPGMKVMLRENLAFSKRLVNGSEGIVRRVVHEVKDGVAYATVAYIEVPGAGKVCQELDEDIVPIFPENVRFKCRMSVGGKTVMKWVSRRQLPLLPAYAYTDYKSQGKSLDYAIVDLQSALSLQGAYVMLSRVRSLSGLMILRSFSLSKVCSNLSQEMRNEFRRIDKLSEDTRLRYEAQRVRDRTGV